MAIPKSISGQVTATALTGQVTENALAKAETDISFINHLGHFMQIAGALFGFNPIETVYFTQELTTQYKSRWWTFSG